MSDISAKKPWTGPRITDIGSIDSRTTAGTGNVGDQATSEHHYSAGTLDTGEHTKPILPEGE